ncbi:hypothetical protein D3C79_758420 [compost metagenome]
MVATGRGDQAANRRLLRQQPLHIHQPAAHLEGAGRCMVFMFDPDLAAQPLRQARPGILRGGGYAGMNQAGSIAQGRQIEHEAPRQDRI